MSIQHWTRASHVSLVERDSRKIAARRDVSESITKYPGELRCPRALLNTVHYTCFRGDIGRPAGKRVANRRLLWLHDTRNTVFIRYVADWW